MIAEDLDTDPAEWLALELVLLEQHLAKHAEFNRLYPEEHAG